jgi:hypothetical protein
LCKEKLFLRNPRKINTVTYPEVDFASDLSSSLEGYMLESFETTDDVGPGTKQPTGSY